MLVILSVHCYSVLNIQLSVCLLLCAHILKKKTVSCRDFVSVSVCGPQAVRLFSFPFFFGFHFSPVLQQVLCSTEICKLQALHSKLNILNKQYREHKHKLNFHRQNALPSLLS